MRLLVISHVMFVCCSLAFQWSRRKEKKSYGKVTQLMVAFDNELNDDASWIRYRIFLNTTVWTYKILAWEYLLNLILSFKLFLINLATVLDSRGTSDCVRKVSLGLVFDVGVDCNENDQRRETTERAYTVPHNHTWPAIALISKRKNCTATQNYQRLPKKNIANDVWQSGLNDALTSLDF